jgi:hypothetical protein
MVWTSEHGLSWTGSALETLGSSSVASAAAQWRDTTVIVGYISGPSGQEAQAWVSKKLGQPFVAASVTSSGVAAEMSEVTAGPLGLFASGTVDGRFALWSSTDGSVWTESSSAEKVIGSQPSAEITSVLAQGAMVYAAGSVRSGASTHAALWASNDGIVWYQVSGTRTAFAAAAGDETIESLAPLGTGLVAVGAWRDAGRLRPVSWISPDGSSWSSPSTQFDIPAGSGGLRSGDSVARGVSSYVSPAGSTTLVAVGGTATQQMAWHSTDGIHWQVMPLPARAAASPAWRVTLAATNADASIVADGDWGQAHLLAWSGSSWSEPSADPKEFGPVQPVAQPQSISSDGRRLSLSVDLSQSPQELGAPARVKMYILTSADGGRTWLSSVGHPSAATPPTAARSTAHYPAGWLAVGSSTTGIAAAWSSVDGRVWTARSLPAAAAASMSVAAATCSTNAGTVAVGASVSQTTPLPRSTTSSPPTSAPSTSRAPGQAGRQPLPPSRASAWTFGTGGRWQTATTAPANTGPGDEAMMGCGVSGGTFYAYGATSSPDGGTIPALWRSSTGRTWIRGPSNGFVADATGPLVSAAADGAAMVAVAGPISVSAWLYGDFTDPTGPASPSQGLWVAADLKTGWVLVDTASQPWQEPGGHLLDLAAYAGGAPVVVGSAGNRLAVWRGDERDRYNSTESSAVTSAASP